MRTLLVLGLLGLLASCHASEKMNPPLQLEIDEAGLRFRVVATVAGEAAQFDAAKLRTFYGAPAGARVTVRDAKGKPLNVRPYTPTIYSSSVAPQETELFTPTKPGPVTEWYAISDLTARMEARKRPDDWYELQIEFDLGTKAPLVSKWLRVSPETVRGWTGS